MFVIYFLPFLLLASLSVNAREGVWILANKNSDKSLELAFHYADSRDISREYLIALPMPKKETITARDYIDTIYNPLLRALEERGAINVLFDDALDAFGREKFFFVSHRIEYLVTCFGVPLKFTNDLELAELDGPPLPKVFNTIRGAVDSDLSLLPIHNSKLLGPIDNPLYNQKRPSVVRRKAVIRVSRLDGPDMEKAKALVDNALRGEAEGVWGRALVDIGGPHKQGDDWLTAVRDAIKADKWELSEKPTRKRFDALERSEDTAVYFGWYTGRVDGPFRNRNFKFAPGAFGLHIHSFSAGTLRTRIREWTPALIDRGITATVGNVYEPYLHLTHQPHLIYDALREGKTWGEAVYYGLAGLSWQAISIGDPLYRPFLGGIEAARTRKSEHPYAWLMKTREIEQTEGVASAVEHLLDYPDFDKHVSMRLETARLQSNSDRKKALDLLSVLDFQELLDAEPLPIAVEFAERHAQWGSSQRALEVFDVMIERTDDPDVKELLKARGRKIAMDIVDLDRTARWAPPPPKEQKEKAAKK